MNRSDKELNKRLISITILLAFTVLILAYTLSIIMFKFNYINVSGVNDQLLTLRYQIASNETQLALKTLDNIDKDVKFLNNICFNRN